MIDALQIPERSNPDGSGTHASRVLDKELQKLRKAGKIHFAKQHWRLIAEQSKVGLSSS